MLFPKPLRKFVAIFRGDVSPTLILLSTALGLWFGLTPGWYGIHAVLLIVALVLNIHLGIFILVAGFGRGLAYAAAPLLYHLGLWAQANLDGLLGGLGALPLVGMTDFARCAVAGATVAGPLLGGLAGLLFAWGVGLFRKTWLRLDEGSEVFRRWQQKSWVRWLDWFLLGKRAKDAKAAVRKRSSLIRIPGVIAAAVVLVAAGVGLNLAQGDRLKGLIADRLTELNGAEVAIADFQLEPWSGRVSAAGIQIVDRERPTHDRVRVGGLTADAGLWNLLRGRVVVDEVALSDVQLNIARDAAGKVVERPEKPASEAQAAREAFDPAQLAAGLEDAARFVEYLKQGSELPDKLREAAEWLPERQPEPPPTPVPAHYLAYLSARGPTPPTPNIVVRKVTLDPVSLPVKEFSRSRVVCENLSDAPWAARLPVRITIDAADATAELRIVCRYDRAEGGADVSGRFADVDLRQIQERLNDNNPVRFEGGTATAELSGSAGRQFVDLRLAVQTQGMQARTTGQGFFGLDPQVAQEALRALENMKTTLQLAGPIGQPKLAFNSDALKEEFKAALVDAGKRELAGRLDAAIGDKLPEGTPKVDEIADDPLDAGKRALEGFLGGKKKEDQ